MFLKDYVWSIWGGLAIAVAAVLGVIRGWPDLEITHHDLRGPLTGAAFRVVQLSDLHLQRFDSAEKEIVVRVKEVQPDLIVLTGDATDRSDALPFLKTFLTALGKIPVVVVPGNWEHWSEMNFQELEAFLDERPGSWFLLNRRVTLSAKGRSVHVIGLDDFTAGNPDGRLLSIANPNEVTILLQHSPGLFDEPEVNRRMSDQRFTLCLSGHTHGGQVTLGGWAPFRPVGSGRFVAGFYDVPGCRLYVSRGVGTSVLPVRWGPAPEIAVFDL